MIVSGDHEFVMVQCSTIAALPFCSFVLLLRNSVAFPQHLGHPHPQNSLASAPQYPSPYFIKIRESHTSLR